MQARLDISGGGGGRVVSFAVAGVPIPQGSKSATIVGRRVKIGGKTAVIAPRVVLTDLSDMSKKTRGANALKKWRQVVARQAHVARRQAELEKFTGEVAVTAEFVLPRPEGHYTKRGRLTSRAPSYPRRPDVSKLLRAIEDAMTGVVYDDDSQIVEANVSKRYAERGGVGGVMISVRERL